MNIKKYAVVLAAGKGTRMNSPLPKVLMEVAGKPMIFHVLENLMPLQLSNIVIIVGYKKEDVISRIREFSKIHALPEDWILFVEQKEQLGTGHAFLMAEDVLKDQEGYVLVTAGDMPFLSSRSFEYLFQLIEKENSAGVVLGSVLDNPSGYGRLVRDKNFRLLEIIEEKDASTEVKKIKEVNTGCYVFRLPEIFSVLKKIDTNNQQKEYYLPDVIKIYRSQNQFFSDYILKDYREALGANTQEELQYLNHIYNLLYA